MFLFSRFAAEDRDVLPRREATGGVADFGVSLGGDGVRMVRADAEAFAHALLRGSGDAVVAGAKTGNGNGAGGFGGRSGGLQSGA